MAEGRCESADTLTLFRKAIAGEALPREINLAHPTSRDAILFPDLSGHPKPANEGHLKTGQRE